VGTTLGQRLVVVWLVLGGVYAILYAGFSSLPPLWEQPVPPVWWALGVTTLVAALGVLRMAAWGRLLAIVVVAFSLVWGSWAQVYWMGGTDLSGWIADWRWLNPAINLVPAALALWWLVRRWPSPRRLTV
jgi:hypothetical protein